MNKTAQNTLQDYYTQYNEYNTFFEKFIENLKPKEIELVEKIKEGATKADIKDIATEVYVLKIMYAEDLQLLSEKVVIWFDVNINLENKVDNSITELVGKLRPIIKDTKFIMADGKPNEKVIGYVDGVKQTIEEQGLIDKLLTSILESNKKED